MSGSTGVGNVPRQQQTSGGRRGGGRGRKGGRRSREVFRASESQHPQKKDASDDQQDLKSPPPACTDFDVAYFEAYAHIGIHEEMIKDHVRTEAYRDAVMQHQSFIQGKVVVDVGCGTGILSIFCAQAGAKRVYAVDASAIAVQAKEVVKANNLAETVIVLHGRVEDVEIDEQVDVIISEWMGYTLLYESMLGSVITARDRWLKHGGLILPCTATLYLAPITHPDRYNDSIDFWRNVYGIDMSAMLPVAKQCAFEEPCVETITGENVLTWPHVVKHVDCYTIQLNELESISTRYKFQSMMRAPLHGFAFWFDVEFSGPANSSIITPSQSPLIGISDDDPVDDIPTKKRTNLNEPLVLSTAPEDPPTHWQQTLIYLYDPIEVEQDQIIEGSVTLSQSKENRRFMNIHLQYSSGGRSFVKESVFR
ncbi:putative protein arginine N-methyltransferase 6 [Gossypium arboreum]|uniref:Protein arginine N-methyltransferase domain-containing protein n=2 Tax=Gossypium TaxID=3633 RepID=A0A0B0MNC5_GOSAR|nr:probable protein arginine N-methyltransferase 6 isoform X2 [Gossypium arboreum]KHG01009.1 putative protein arginine N-methyltransferase 6 [Gossypium arboreum]